MNRQEVSLLVDNLAKALATRDYALFLRDFDSEATFEVPFAIEGEKAYSGIDAIREHFNRVAQNPLFRLVQLDEVTGNWSFDAELGTLVVAYQTKATVVSNGEAFEIASSVARITIKNGKIAHYSDYPNTLGLAKAAGLLPQLAARFAVG